MRTVYTVLGFGNVEFENDFYFILSYPHEYVIFVRLISDKYMPMYHSAYNDLETAKGVVSSLMADLESM